MLIRKLSNRYVEVIQLRMIYISSFFHMCFPHLWVNFCIGVSSCSYMPSLAFHPPPLPVLCSPMSPLILSICVHSPPLGILPLYLHFQSFLYSMLIHSFNMPISSESTFLDVVLYLLHLELSDVCVSFRFCLS